MSSPSSQIIQLLRLHESFFTETIAILGLVTTAFTPLLQYSVLSPPLHSFMLSTYCVMMMLCTIALCADVCLCSTSLNSRAHRWSGILRAVVVLTGLLAVFSLLSISKPYIASVSLFMWLLLAIHLILSLYWDLTQPILPITINTTSNSISVLYWDLTQPILPITINTTSNSIRVLYWDLTQPILPITINTTSNFISVVFNSVNAVFGVMKN